MSKRRQYSAEFKSKLVLELLKEQKTVTQLATENGISPSMLVRWRDEALSKLSMVLEDSDSSKAAKEKAKLLSLNRTGLYYRPVGPSDESNVPSTGCTMITLHGDPGR